MRYLVTGVSGLLGINLALLLAEQNEVIGAWNNRAMAGLPFEVWQGDLTDEAFLPRLIEGVSPDIVIHCAAMANIDICEKHPEDAMRVNAELPAHLAMQTQARGIRLLHLSTDAVFDGTASGCYKETDAVNPTNVYTRTKLAGEQAVLQNDPNALVARVNFYGWSPSGTRSLAEFFYNNLSAGKQVNGFDDIFFCPLYVRTLAAVLEILSLTQASGIYHVTSSECLSKYAFGRLAAESFGFDPELVRPVSWKEGGLVAQRSSNLRLDNRKLVELLGYELPGPAEGLAQMRTDLYNGLRDQINQIFTSN